MRERGRDGRLDEGMNRGREGGFDEVDSFFEMSFSEQLREILYSLPEGR